MGTGCAQGLAGRTAMVLVFEQHSICEDLAGGTEEGNATIIIADGMAALLVKWNVASAPADY